MIWTLLADLVLAVHASWVLFVILGPLWCWKRPRLRAVHLTMMALTLGFMAILGGCPLSDLENLLSRRADPAASYAGGFIGHYLMLIIYWDIPARAIGLATSLWFLGWAAVYWRLWVRERGNGMSRAQ